MIPSPQARRPRLVPFVPAAVLLLALAGCAGVERADLAARAQVEMVGLTREALLACAGAPEKILQSDERELLVYLASGEIPDRRPAGPVGMETADLFRGFTDGYCEATFVLKEGRVIEVRYRGMTGGLFTRREQCAPIVRYCVK